MGGLVWHVGIGMQDESAMLQHAGGVVAHGGFGLDVEIAQHFIAAPAPNQADHVCVDLGPKECHCAGRAKRAGRDVRGQKAQGGA